MFSVQRTAVAELKSLELLLLAEPDDEFHVAILEPAAAPRPGFLLHLKKLTQHIA